MRLTSGGGPYFDIIPISVAELRNPALIPAKNLATQVVRNTDGTETPYPGLSVLRPVDFQSILALDPLASGDPTAQPQSQQRYVDTLERPVVEGPDQAGAELNATTDSLAYSTTETASTTTSSSYTEGASFSLGPVSFSDSDTLVTTTVHALFSTTGQQTSVTLGSSTVKCCNPSPTGMGGNCHLDAYEDLLFQTYALVPEPYGCGGILPPGSGTPFTHPQAVEGQLMNAQNQPEPNTPVTVKLPNGQALRVFTDSKGRFSVYEAPDGRVAIQAGNATEAISIKNGTSQPLTLRQH
jgi:hypothetical protein